MGTPGFPDVPGLTEAGIGKTRDVSGSWLYASISIGEPAGHRLRLSRHPAGGPGDVLLDATTALWLLQWLCIVLYQPGQRGRWRLRLPEGPGSGVLLDPAAALRLLGWVCVFLYQPMAPGPGADAWFLARA
ncbi:MAG: hypothetical protein ACRDNF_07500 [Streptosporangiaceae bacterium]